MLEENSYQVTAWQLPERESPTRDKDWSLLNQTSKMYPHESSRWVCGESCESLQLIPWSDREPHVGFDMAKMMFLWSENDNEIYNAAFSHFGLSSPLQGVLFLHYSATYINRELIIKRTKKKSHLVSQIDNQLVFWLSNFARKTPCISAIFAMIHPEYSNPDLYLYKWELIFSGVLSPECLFTDS